MSWPLRICQPVSPSARSWLHPLAPANSQMNIARKSRSAIEGTSLRRTKSSPAVTFRRKRVKLEPGSADCAQTLGRHDDPERSARKIRQQHGTAERKRKIRDDDFDPVRLEPRIVAIHAHHGRREAEQPAARS